MMPVSTVIFRRTDLTAELSFSRLVGLKTLTTIFTNYFFLPINLARIPRYVTSFLSYFSKSFYFFRSKIE